MELNTIYLAPYHGTPIAKAPEQYGLKLCRERMDHALASMQGVVLETETLSADDIIQAKTWFDQELKQAYFQEAKQCKKTDIYRAKRGTDANNWHWRYAWNEFPHLADFVKHLTETEQTFSEEKYPIRVGIDFHQTTEQDIQAADRTLSRQHSKGLAVCRWQTDRIRDRSGTRHSSSRAGSHLPSSQRRLPAVLFRVLENEGVLRWTRHIVWSDYRGITCIQRISFSHTWPARRQRLRMDCAWLP